MAKLKYVVLEYLPHMMTSYDEWIPARVDGHYLDKSDAIDVANMWIEDQMHKESRIVVVEVIHEAKAPAHWVKRKLGDA